jgi:hypothetical protein
MHFLQKSFTNYFHQYSFLSHALKFAVKYLFPDAKIKFSISQSNHHLTTYDGAFKMSIGVVFLASNLPNLSFFSQSVVEIMYANVLVYTCKAQAGTISYVNASVQLEQARQDLERINTFFEHLFLFCARRDCSKISYRIIHALWL